MLVKPPLIRKIWGITSPLVVTPMFEMHQLFVEPNMQCSLHIHRFKHNAFYVLSGTLFIDLAEGENEYDTEPRTKILLTGDYTTIRPGVHHKFRTEYGCCSALEMYYTEPLSEDIVRRTIGGPANGR